jgi:hypothetical protein
MKQFVKPLSISHLLLRQKVDSCDKSAIINGSIFQGRDEQWAEKNSPQIFDLKGKNTT